MISEMLHIDNEFNDLPISDRKTQFGCNAIPERQDMADEVTRSNGRNGVAYYIETKILQYRRILYSCILRDLAWIIHDDRFHPESHQMIACW